MMRDLVRDLGLLGLAAFLLAGCSDDFGGCTSDCVSVNDGGGVIKGSGTAKTESRTVAPFTAIRLEIGGRAEIERTGAALASWWRMIFSENRYPLFGIMR
jgi:hypothetical protein